MSSASLLSRVQTLLETPTAPFHEEWMCETLDHELALIPGLEVATDGFGNRIVRLRRGSPQGTPVTFVAHLDHPGFVLTSETRRLSNGLFHYDAEFEGRVFDSFFNEAQVRLFRSRTDPGVRGRIVSAGLRGGEQDNRPVVIETEEAVDGAALAMWDLPPFSHRDNIIEGRACDDLAGCAALLEMLDRLAHQRGEIDTCVLFTRAEESGFCGTLCFLAESLPHPLVPSETVFVSVEISSETPAVRVGEGAIIRLGDRSSTFDGRTADLLWAMAGRTPQHLARRALMDKGTCEATPFSRAGHRAGGICAPVANYHNMDPETGMIATERVALSDLEALAGLAVGLATSSSRGEQPAPRIPHNYELYLRKGRERLCAFPLTAQTSN